MIEINLLPWRDLRRERKKKQFGVYLLLGFLAAILVVFLINTYAKRLIEAQTHRNQILENEIARIKKQIKEIEEIKTLRQALIARMTIVQSLQGTRVRSK